MIDSTNDDYTPFPEGELVALADHFANIAKAWSATSATSKKLRDECLGREAVCRNAIKSHTALRERMLVGELERAQGKVFRYADDDRDPEG